MLLSVVIVNYNVKFYLTQCLWALQQTCGVASMEIIVVDNHSTDGSMAFLKPRFPNVRFIPCQHNLGFAKANNIGIRQSQGEYVLLLNPDTFVGEHTLADALAFMQTHPQAGCAGFRMRKADGSVAMESRRGIPTPLTAGYKMMGLHRLFPHHRHFAHYYLGHLPWNEAAQIEVVSGACMLLRRKALLQVGLLDEDYFMYGEDIELSYQLLKCGWQNWYLPLDILHYKGKSTAHTSFRYVHVFYKAMLIFLRKHYARITWLIRLPIQLLILAKACIAMLQTARHYISKYFNLFPVKRKQKCYLFIGKKDMIAECKTFATANALHAQFIEQTAEAPYIKAIDNTNEGKRQVIVVYDTQCFTYDTILQQMHRLQQLGYMLGTFRDHILLTQDEAICTL